MFDLDLHKMRREFFAKSQLYSKHPTDPIVRGSFFNFRKNYRKLCRQKYREFKTSIIQKLETVHDKDPNSYRKLI